MIPYYQDDAVTIYHGDCRDVQAWLTGDVLITDPPYGRAWSQGDTGSARGWRSDRHGGIEGDKDTSARDDALMMWGERPGFVFGDLMLAPPQGTRLVLIYDKGGDAGFTGAVAGFRRNAEAVYAIGRHSSGLGGASSILRSGVSCGGNLARTTGHPHTKPLDVMGVLIDVIPGVVVDPFMGSGSTLRAAKDRGRRAIGIELDEGYCEIAARRCAQEVLAL